jgi:hypothetical protein
VKAEDTQQLAKRKARIEDRLDGSRQWESERPVIESTNLRYGVSGRVEATGLGGIGLVHEFVREPGVCLPRQMRSEANEIRRMEFRRFLHSLILLPCQLVRTARRRVLRILSYSPWARVLIDGTEYFRNLRMRA